MRTTAPFAVCAALAVLAAGPLGAESGRPEDACRWDSFTNSPAPTYVESGPKSSQTVTQPEGTGFSLSSRVTTFGSGDPAEFGELVIARDSDDSVHSVIHQAGDQAHLRLTFGTDKSGNDRPRHLLIGPYNYGAAVEYPGTFEFWVENFSVHNNWASNLNKEGAWFWVGDQVDAGGLFATSYYDADLRRAYSVIASDLFTHLSHGSLHFQVRNPDDAFRFQWGPFGSETTLAELGQSSSSTYLSLRSGSVSGSLETDGSSGAVRLASDGASLELLPGGGVELPSAAAFLAVGADPASSGALRLCLGCGIGFGDHTSGAVEGVGSAPGATLLHDRRYLASLAAFAPTDDGVRDLGLANGRWNNIRAVHLSASGSAVSGLNLVPSGPTPVFDAALGNTQKIVLEEDVAASALVNGTAGQPLTFLVCQDAAGKHKFVWPANVRGGMSVGTLAGRCTAQSFISDGSVAWAVALGVANQ